MYKRFLCVGLGLCPFLELVEGTESVRLFGQRAFDCDFYEFGEEGEVGADVEAGIEVVEQSC